MPCRDDAYDAYAAEEQAREHHRVTRLLCEIMRGLDEDSILYYYTSPDGLAWWKDHHEQDRQRQLKENLERVEEEKRLRQQISEAQAKLLALKGGKP